VKSSLEGDIKQKEDQVNDLLQKIETTEANVIKLGKFKHEALSSNKTL